MIIKQVYLLLKHESDVFNAENATGWMVFRILTHGGENGQPIILPFNTETIGKPVNNN
jgi:hypothetical protein